MKIRYYKLFALLKERGIRVESLCRKAGLDPSALARIETNRILDPQALFLLCRYLECTIDDVMEYFNEDEPVSFYSARILERHSYTPTPPIPKEFKMP